MVVVSSVERHIGAKLSGQNHAAPVQLEPARSHSEGLVTKSGNVNAKKTTGTNLSRHIHGRGNREYAVEGAVIGVDDVDRNGAGVALVERPCDGVGSILYPAHQLLLSGRILSPSRCETDQYADPEGAVISRAPVDSSLSNFPRPFRFIRCNIPAMAIGRARAANEKRILNSERDAWRACGSERRVRRMGGKGKKP